MKNLRYYIIILLLLLSVSTIFSSLIIFRDKELYLDTENIIFWSRSSKGNIFYHKKYLYLDRLNRNQTYKLSFTIKTINNTQISDIEVDGKSIEFQHKTIREFRKDNNIIKINHAVFNIPESDKSGVIISIKLIEVNKRRNRNDIKNSTVKSAILAITDIKYETLKHLFRIVIAAILSFTLHLILMRKDFDMYGSFLFSLGTAISIIYIINSTTFNYVYMIGTKTFINYLFMFFIVLSFIVALYRFGIRIYHEKNVDPEQEKIIQNRLRLAALFSLFVIVLTLSAYLLLSKPVCDDFLLLRDIDGKELASMFTGTFDPTGSLPRYYRPIPMIILQGQHRLFGDSYVFFYLVGIFQNFLNLVLLFLIVELLTNAVLPALISSLVFLTSAYTGITMGWIGETFSVSVMSFMLASLYFLLKSDSQKHSILSIMFLVFALMSKESAVMLPFMLLFADFLYRKWKTTKRFLFHLFSFSFLAAYFIFRYIFLDGLTGATKAKGYYTLSNIPDIFERIIFLFKLIFISPVRANNIIFEGRIWWLIRTFTIMLPILFLIYLLIKKKKHHWNKIRAVGFIGITWSFFMMMPILFPFDFIRLAYILIPGVSLVFAAFTLLIERYSKGSFLKITFYFLICLSLSQQAVKHQQMAYFRLGKGSAYRFHIDQECFIVWGKKLPEKDRLKWKFHLYEEDKLK